MKKFILKLILWFFILLFVLFSIVLGLGYLKYKNAKFKTIPYKLPIEENFERNLIILNSF